MECSLSWVPAGCKQQLHPAHDFCSSSGLLTILSPERSMLGLPKVDCGNRESAKTRRQSRIDKEDLLLLELLPTWRVLSCSRRLFSPALRPYINGPSALSCRRQLGSLTALCISLRTLVRVQPISSMS